MNEHDALVKAVEVLDGQTATARALSKRMGIKVTQGQVYNWINRGKRLPDKYGLHVEALTREKGDCILAEWLCPVAFKVA